MSRLPRFVLPGHPQHVIQRGNQSNSCFLSESGTPVGSEILSIELNGLRSGFRVFEPSLLQNVVE